MTSTPPSEHSVFIISNPLTLTPLDPSRPSLCPSRRSISSDARRTSSTNSVSISGSKRRSRRASSSSPVHANRGAGVGENGSGRYREARKESGFVSTADADGIISRLKRLKVSPMSECQRKKQKLMKQRELRMRIKVAIEFKKKHFSQTGENQEQSNNHKLNYGSLGEQKVNKDAQNGFVPEGRRRHFTLNPGKLSDLFSTSLSPPEHRQRHSSDSASTTPTHDPPRGHESPFIRHEASSRSLQDFSQCRKELETIPLVRTSAKEDSHKDDFSQQQFQVVRSESDVLEDEEDEDNVEFWTPRLCPLDPSSSSCAQQARQEFHNDVSVDDLAGYLEDSIVFPKKMSYMAEMMYT